MLHQEEESYKDVLPLNKQVYWLRMRKEKNVTTSNT